MGFYDEFSKYYDIVFPLSEMKLNFIKNNILGNKVLDLAAGTGNYSIALSKMGYDVTAVDLDKEMINMIKKKSDMQGINVKTYQLNMKDIHTIKEKDFDLVFCIGNSIVHLENISEIKDVIGKIHKLLRKDGKILIQIVNYDRILEKNIKELPLIDRPNEGVKFIRNYEIKDNKVLFKTKLVVPEDKIYENCVELYALKSNELSTILDEVGFENIKQFGDFDGNPYSLNSFPIIVTAIKK